MRKLLIALALATSSLCAIAQQTEAPVINPGTNWTFQRVDWYTKLVQQTWKNVVVELADDGYRIERFDANGNVTSRYQITRNLGQGSPAGGRVGDGNLYMFPLQVGKSWTTRSYWKNASGDVGYDEVTYHVVGEESVTVPAGTFATIKVEGNGKQVNETSGGRGFIESTLNYSSQARGTVRSVRVVRPSQAKSAPVRNTDELVAYEIKE